MMCNCATPFRGLLQTCVGCNIFVELSVNLFFIHVDFAPIAAILVPIVCGPTALKVVLVQLVNVEVAWEVLEMPGYHYCLL